MQPKLFLTMFLAFFLAMGISKLEAQTQSSTKKVVIIKKTIDENGKEVTTREEASGEEADKLIEKAKSEKLKDIDIDIELSEEKNIWIDKDGEKKDLKGKSHKMIKKESYKMNIKDDDGNMKVIEWDGEGEVPEEMQEEILKEELETYAREHNVSKKRVKIIKKEEGENIELEWDGEGEMPEEIQELLEEHEIDLEKEIEEIDIEEGDKSTNGKRSKTTIVEIEEEVVQEENQNKVQLGIMIEEHPVGVKITDFIPGTTAEKAGLRKGDIITIFNGTVVNSMESLIQEVGKYKAGDVVEVMAIRGDLEQGYKVTLQARKNTPKTTKKYKWKKAQ
jgi:hypothetical protein